MKIRTLLVSSLSLNLLFVIFFLTGAYVYRDKWLQKLVSVKGNAKIVMYGNSITAQGKWVELLERMDVKNSGLPGLCTYHFLQLVQESVVDQRPRICFMMGGINDITVGVAQEKLQANYRAILETLERNHIDIVVTSTLYERDNPTSKTEVDLLNAFLQRYCKDKQIEYLDLNKILSDSNGLKALYARDRTHLTEAAYKVWAQEVTKILKRRNI